MKCTCKAESDHPSYADDHESHCLWFPEPDEATVLVFRNPAGQPVAVPQAVVQEAERPYRAYQMQMQGHSWMEIARVEQYADAAAAKYDVTRYVEEGKALVTLSSRRNQLALEVARLDAIQAAYWDDGINKKHLPSAKMVLDAIAMRVKTLALAQMSEDDGGEERPTTLIIPSGDDYEAGLQRLADGS